MKILVTGAAGFIGSKLACELAKRGDSVVGIDSITAYYDPRLKIGRLREILGIEPDASWREESAVPATGSVQAEVGYLQPPEGEEIQSSRFQGLSFIRMDITDAQALAKLFREKGFDCVVNLAAQAGVRYSLENPASYVQTNVAGFLNVLECCRSYPVKHLVYASSSSIYGLNSKTPFSEADEVTRPASIYAATKKCDELMAHAYSKLFGIPCTGLRYFTVYGPWGRPDMAPMLFADAISHGEEIKVFNNGHLMRDFTYIDDIVRGTVAAIEHAPSENADGVRYKVYNIGCSHPVPLMDFISELEMALGREAKKTFLPMQPGDVYQTYADTSLLEAEVGYHPSTPLRQGIRAFAEWYNGKDKV
ncbi:MAG: NAD-dependent epimerase/dehydratase family protein [Clostridium sp.]|nr:NAD-dependent epimerase/dehydratase family protein [Clostridium sp.]